MRMHDVRSAVFSASLCSALALGSVACGGGAEAVEQENVVVLSSSEVTSASLADIRSGVVLTGTLDPYLRVEVKAQVEGTATRIDVDRGDDVRPGQPLVFISAEGVQSRAFSAEAAVAASEASLAQARRQLESARTLHDAGALSDIDFSSTETLYQSTEAQLASVRAQAAGAAEEARRMTVSSPIAGEVSERSVNEGEAVSNNQTLLTVVNSSILELDGQVPVEEAATVHEGQPVEFTIDAYPGQLFQGTVSRVAPVADPGTRQVGVSMRLPNQDRLLIGGLFARGRVITGTREQAIVIPQAAVRGTNEGLYVLVVNGEAIERRQVTVGAVDPTEGVVEILTGVVVGDRVVVSPGDVPVGTRVRVGGTTDAPSSAGGV
ncbi:MAG: efflux RND transporter periplasmic adaptor subunit [Gemmatimonadetes bacterium]|nr:efflux RND transporter periplasmic adaptor subunit [Gemmatimonadota bacterium]